MKIFYAILIIVAIIVLAYSFWQWRRSISSEEIKPTYTATEQKPEDYQKPSVDNCGLEGHECK